MPEIWNADKEKEHNLSKYAHLNAVGKWTIVEVIQNSRLTAAGLHIPEEAEDRNPVFRGIIISKGKKCDYPDSAKVVTIIKGNTFYPISMANERPIVVAVPEENILAWSEAEPEPSKIELVSLVGGVEITP